MKDKVVLLSHYDLDGAGCSVLADHIWDVVDRKHQGYPKIRKSLGYLIGEHSLNVDTIVIADLKMEIDDLLLARLAFKNVIYYDHHESSEEFASYASPTFHFNFSLDLCSTALMWMDGVRNRGAVTTKELNAFANVVNTYDLWKNTTGRWQQGVFLNDLFWHLHMDDFRTRFKDGFAGFTQSEIDWHADLEEKRKEVIDSATVEEMESGSKVVVLSESKGINFVSTQMDGDLFYIISPDFSMHNVSVRTKEGFKINVNSAISFLAEKYPDKVLSAGGHAAAGGITFKDHLSLNDMVDFLYETDELIRETENKL